jgi:hypothetical protein
MPLLSIRSKQFLENPILKNVHYIPLTPLRYETRFHPLITNFGSKVSVVPLIFCLFSLQFILACYHPFPVSRVMCYVHTEPVPIIKYAQNISLLFPLTAAAACFTSTPSNVIQPRNREAFQLTVIFSLRKQVFPFQHKAIMFIISSTLKHGISEVPNSSIITKCICQQKDNSSVAEGPFSTCAV